MTSVAPYSDFMEKYFFCYSNRLYKALIANGFKPICVALNCRTHGKFWLFVGTDELNEYKNNKYQNERDKY